MHELNPCIYSCYCSYSWCVIFSFIRICRICFDVPVEKIIFSYTFVVDLKVKADKFIFDFFCLNLTGSLIFLEAFCYLVLPSDKVVIFNKE